MKRFQKKRQVHIKPLYCAIVLFIGFVVLFVIAVDMTGKGNYAREEEALRSAIERDIMHCYALEGYYPPSVDYMKEHYALSYDSSKYIVDYQPIGKNIYPAFTIIRKGGQ